MRALRGSAVIALATAAAALSAVSAPASPSAAASRCPVTVPVQSVPRDAGFGPAAFNYGNARLRVHLGWPQGTLPAGILPSGGSYATVMGDGSIWLKLGWWRGLARKLVISGRRLDGPAPPLEADVPSGYGATGFVPSGLVFPTLGCWRVHGALGPAKLTFVVKVVKLTWH